MIGRKKISCFLELLSSIFIFVFLGCSARSGALDNFPEVDEDIEPPRVPERLEGSLFDETSPFASMYSDLKAKRVGDIVIVHIIENVQALNEQRKDMLRHSEFGNELGAGITKSPKIPGVGNEGISLGFSSSGKDDLRSRGIQKSQNKFVATVAARVIRVLPSGNLLIEGAKTIRHNEELQKIYVRGIVRPEDIMHDNSVPSTALANAKIEYVSDGDFASKMRQGWLRKIFDFINPF